MDESLTQPRAPAEAKPNTQAETLAPPAPADPDATAAGVPSAPADGSVPPELADHPHYRVLGLIGQGGMGAVYKAEHRLMERTVALKVIKPALFDNPGAAHRFRQEVKAAARLQHPNIVTAHDAGQAGPLHFLVMEYVEGRSLAEYLQEKGTLPAAEACEYARQAAVGLQHAHEKGMVHRDVKPHNLMRTPDGLVKILDFGLARFGQAAEPRIEESGTLGGSAAGSLTQVGAIVGTADYMAPEQATDSHRADIRADIYSLGCTLYHLLTGSVPYPGGSALDKLTRHAVGKPPDPRTLRRDLSPGLAAVVRKMMARDPADRFQTPGEVATALAPFAAPPRKRRRRRTAVLVGLLAVLLAAGVSTLIYTVIGGKPSVPNVPTPVTMKFPGPLVAVGAPSPADALRREDMPPEALALAGGGDPKAAPAELVAVLGGTRFRNTGLAGFPAYSPDGKTLAVPGGNDILLFDAATGQLRRSLVGHTKRVYRVVFSPDGKTLASVGYDGKVKVWDPATGRETRSLPAPVSGDAGLTFVPQLPGSWLAVGGQGGGVWLWDLTDPNRRKVFARAQGVLSSLAANPSRPLVAAGSETGVVYVWNSTTGLLLNQLRIPIGAGDAAEHIAVAFSPNGELLAAANGTTLKVWDAADLKEVWSAPAAGGGLTTFTPDGKTLVTASHFVASGESHIVRRWRAEDGAALAAPLRLGKGNSWASWALRPDGMELAAGSNVDGVVSLYDLETGRPRFPESGHTAWVRSVAFSPNGRTLASGADDGLVKVWNLATGKVLHTLTGHDGEVRCVAYSPDGATLATGGADGTVRLWDPADGSALHVCKAPAGRSESIAFHPSGRTLAVCCNDLRVYFWDVATGDAVGDPVTVAFFPEGLAYRPDGGALAVVGNDHQITLLNPDTHAKITADSDPGSLTKAAFFPDGRSLATVSSDGTVKLRDPATVAIQRTLAGKAAEALGKIAVRPDGRMVAASGFDGCLRLWDLVGADPPRRKVFALAPMGYWIDAVAFSPDGRYLAAGNPDGTIYLFRLAPPGKLPELPAGEGSFREERSLAGHTHDWVHSAAFTADGRHVLTCDADNKVRRWDLGADAAPEVFDGCPRNNWAVAFAGGDRLISGGRDGKVRLWDFRAGKEIYFCEGHTGMVHAVALSADGRLVLTGGDGGAVRLWNAANGLALGRMDGHTASVRCVCLSADGGRALTGGLDGTVRYWDARAGKCLHVFEGYQRENAGLCLSADGKRAAWGGDDGLIHVWDFGRDEERLRLPFDDGSVRGVAFSPDGKRLLAGGDKGLLALWDAETGRVLDRTRTASVITAAFSPDGRRAVTGNADKTARIWILPDLEAGP